MRKVRGEFCIPVALAIGLLQLACCPAAPGGGPKAPWTMKFDKEDAGSAGRLERSLKLGAERIEKFFGQPFAKPFIVEIHPNRAKFDEYFKRRWNIPKTEKWMVASGVADTLTVLSPRVWKTEAVEHDPNDEAHFLELVAHEMVHVYHGQRNPKGDFDGMDDLGWLIEGLAVFVSGQLENSHRDAARAALKTGQIPKTLSGAWNGKYRYGMCGSMVRYIDEKAGRKTLIKLLPLTKNEEILELLAMSEREFLQRWRNWVK